MKRLGEILVARGAATKEQVQSALTACKRNGGRVGTWLVRLGHINESVLLTALAEQSARPPVTALELASAGSEVRALVPATFARRHLVAPFARRGRTLHVGMVNPNDQLLVDEIAGMTGMQVRPFVATEAALTAALAIPLTAAARAGGGPTPGPPRGSQREWRQFWRLESSLAELAAALPGGSRPHPRTASASFPALETLEEDLAQHATSDLGELAERLRLIADRDDVVRHLLPFLGGLASRVALLSVHQGRVMGWAARGDGVIDHEFHTLMLPIDRPSVLLNLTRGVDVHVGPVGALEGNVVLLQALGRPPASQAVVAPIKVRGKIVAFIWLDDGDRDPSGIPVATVLEAARLAGLALEVIVLRQKIRTSGSLTERPEAH